MPTRVTRRYRLVHWWRDFTRPLHPPGPPPRWRRLLPVALLGLAAAGIIVAGRVGLPGEVDPLAPFVIGSSWGMDRALAADGVSIAAGPSQYGYDGQWFLGQAYDPLLRGEVATSFDSPRYRALRMLLPAAGWLLAAGQPPAIPYALLAVQILAVGLGCAACGRIVANFGRSRWWGLGFAAIPGVVVGVAFGTAEPLGLALVALGLSLTLERRYAWAGLALAGAALAKETYLLSTVVVAGYLAIDGYRDGRAWLRRVAMVTAPGLAALAAWWAYVASVLPPDSDSSERVRDVFSVPFAGWVDVLATLVRGEYAARGDGEAVVVITAVLLLAAGVHALLRRPSLLPYLALVWVGYAISLSALLLGRYLSAQRALAPAVLAAGLLLLTTSLVHERRNDPASSSKDS